MPRCSLGPALRYRRYNPSLPTAGDGNSDGTTGITSANAAARQAWAQ